ncbi:hypothetical protein chiPu_0025087, partial [Chiloscyllium punctatum]|nr:hypothetical protein [Chiloscyllium punctatum]
MSVSANLLNRSLIEVSRVGPGPQQSAQYRPGAQRTGAAAG